MVYVTARHMVGGSGHEHIASVRWRNPESGATGEATRAGMVEFIDVKKGDARVEGSPDARVGVVNADPKYIRTYADGEWTNNLLSLPTF